MRSSIAYSRRSPRSSAWAAKGPDQPRHCLRHSHFLDRLSPRGFRRHHGQGMSFGFGDALVLIFTMMMSCHIVLSPNIVKRFGVWTSNTTMFGTTALVLAGRRDRPVAGYLRGGPRSRSLGSHCLFIGPRPRRGGIPITVRVPPIPHPCHRGAYLPSHSDLHHRARSSGTR